MPNTYGELVKNAREKHTPPLTSKNLAVALNVQAPFITDIEKGRRLPSLKNQKKIKEILANSEFPAELFDDCAALDIMSP